MKYRHNFSFLFYLILLFTTNILHGEYLVYEQKNGSPSIPIEKQYKKIFNILMTYKFPMRTNPYIENTITNQDKLLLQKLSEKDFLEQKIQKTIDPNLRVIFVPKTIYELFFFTQFLDRSKDLWVDDLIEKVAILLKVNKKTEAHKILQEKAIFTEKEIGNLIKDINSNKEIFIKRNKQKESFLQKPTPNQVYALSKGVNLNGGDELIKIIKKYFIKKIPFLSFYGEFHQNIINKDERDYYHQLFANTLDKYGKIIDQINRKRFIYKACFLINEKLLNFLHNKKLLSKIDQNFLLTKSNATKTLGLFQEIFTNFYTNPSYMMSYHNNQIGEDGYGSWDGIARSMYAGKFPTNHSKIKFTIPPRSKKPKVKDEKNVQNVLQKAISIEYEAQKTENFVLYRGKKTSKVNGHNLIDWPLRDHNIRLRSLGNSLYAGIFKDGTPLSSHGQSAVALHFITAKPLFNIAYALFISKKDKNSWDNLFYTPPFNTLAGLAGVGEMFHTKSKSYNIKDFNYKRIMKTMPNDLNNNIVKTLLMSPLNKKEFVLQFSQYITDNIRFIKCKKDSNEKELVNKKFVDKLLSNHRNNKILNSLIK
jgi:hypothetical protein